MLLILHFFIAIKKQLQKAKELQQLLTIILQSDRDGDNIIQDSELQVMLLRLKTFTPCDTTKLREAFVNAGVTEKMSSTTLYRNVASDTYMDDADDFNLGDAFVSILDDFTCSTCK